MIFTRRFNAIWVVQPCAQKYFAFPEMQIRCMDVPFRAVRGAFAQSSPNAARDAMDASARETKRD
jgi:hypothetical protein